jgi:hypothetical protein
MPFLGDVFAANASRLEVVDDVPGRRLVLAHAGLPPLLAIRVPVTLLLLPWAIFPIAVNPAPPAGIVALCLGICAVVSFLSGLPTRYCSRLAFDSDPGAIGLRMTGWFLWFSWTTSIAVDELTGFQLRISETGDTGLTFTLEVRCRRAGMPARAARVVFRTFGFDDRPRARDLAFRIAAILRWSGHVVHRDDARALEIELVRDAAVTPNAKACPPPDVRAAHEIEATAGRFQEPEVAVGPPSLEDLARICACDDLKSWKPGELVRTHRAPFSGSWYGVYAAVGALVGGIIGAAGCGRLVATLAGTGLGGVASGLVVAIAGAMVGLAYAWAVGREREATLDWSSRTAAFRHGRSRRAVPFEQIAAVVIRGRCSRTKRRRYSFSCTLEADVAGKRAWLLETGSFKSDSETPYRTVLPFAVELARSLDVRYRWAGYPD